ncbi:MAG: phenylalanine--tRNA ligase subunit beta [Candidatus Nomurabacteria bacterium]
MKISNSWLQNYFEEKLPSPEEISQGIIFHSFEVEDYEKVGEDTIFDIKVLPDRAHDCLSHWGIAKEVSMIFDLKIKEKIFKNFENKPTNLRIKIEDEKCLRYMGRIVRNIKVGESPEWLKEKLRAIGQKPINNVVDTANFVMYDLGQPIHCFDLDKLESESLIVRNGIEGETITTLDKKEIKLDESILVIADEKYPLAIAGIKGGTRAEVDMNTKNIVIEVANFNPTTTRKTSKKINILTDAVKRYENEISPELCSLVMDAVTDMIYSLAQGEVENVVDVYPKKSESKSVKVSVDYINKRLGSEFSKKEIEGVWNKLNFSYKDNDGDFDIQIPALRLDLGGPHDLVEEVIRVIGYDKLPETLPVIKNENTKSGIFYKMLVARNKLLNDGYSEVMTYAFRDKGEVEVLSSAMGKNFLRNNITDGLKESIKLNTLNLPLLDMNSIKIFEIGTVFYKDKEEVHVAYGDKKGIIEFSLEEFITKNVSQGEFINSNSNSILKPFKMWSLYPFISRDIAVWVPSDEDKNKLKNILIEEGTDLLIKEPYLFDSFSKDGKTSYAYRLVFQSYEKTLTDEKINPIMEKINSKISSLGWQVR